MKIKLLNNGGYYFGKIKYPITVNAKQIDVGYMVLGTEIARQGGEYTRPLSGVGNEFEYFFDFDEVEVVPDCKAIRQGDQMQCVCGLAWDIDDTDLPECRV